jgi:glycosyltransferase involved in cell wall biosynthesis
MSELDRQARVVIAIENAAYPLDRRVSLEAMALREAGYRVTVVAPMGHGEMDQPHEWIDGVEVFRYLLPSSQGGVASYIAEYSLAVWHIARLVLRIWVGNGFDILQVCNPPDIFFPIGFLIKLFGKRFVFDQHDLTPETFAIRYGTKKLSGNLLHRVLLACERLTYAQADAVLATNQSIRKFALERGKVDSRKVFVVRNGPNEQRLQRVEPDLPLKCGRTFLVCYVGWIHRQDGAEYALRAADWIVHVQGRTDITFAFLGDGDFLPDLREEANARNLQDYVVFTGFVGAATVMRYLCTADVGMAPEPKNGMNEFLTMIKVMEYMAVGLPTIAFDLQETRYSAQGAARYARPNDISELGRLTLELLDDPAQRAELGRLGRQRVLDELGWVHNRKRLLEAYEFVLGAKAPRTSTEELPGQVSPSG